MKKILIFLSLLMLSMQFFASDSVRKRNTPPRKSPDQELAVVTHTQAPFGRRGSLEHPSVAIVVPDDIDEGSIRDSQFDGGADQTGLLRPTESMWRRILASVRLQQDCTHADTRNEDGIRTHKVHRQYTHYAGYDRSDTSQRKIGLCCFKTASVLTLFMLVAGFGWLSYENWQLTGALAGLSTTTTRLAGTVTELSGTVDRTVVGLTSQVGGVTIQLAALDQRVNGLAVMVGNVAQDIPAAVGNLQNEILRANTLAVNQTDLIASRITALAQQAQALTDGLGNVNALQQSAALAIATAQEQIRIIGPQLAGLNGTVASLQQNINPLAATTPAFIAQIQALTAQVNGLGAQINALGVLVPGGLPTLAPLPTLPPIP